MKVKQHTIAGPRSPRIRNKRIVVTIAINAKIKKYKRLFQDAYSEINFSFVARNPARNIITRNFTISLGWKPNRFTLTPLPSGPVPRKIVRTNKPIAANAHGQPFEAFLVFLKTNKRNSKESGVKLRKLKNKRMSNPDNPPIKYAMVLFARNRSRRGPVN